MGHLPVSIVSFWGSAVRFVFVSFIFLFWAFYELSGGADFEPRGRRSAPEPVVARTAEAVPERGESRTRVRNRPVAAEALVARRAMATRAEDAGIGAETKPAARSAAGHGGGAAERPALRITSAASGGLALFPAVATGAGAAFAVNGGAAPSLASISQRPAARTNPAEAGLQPDTVAAEPAPDIREIAGTRVNMRSGPGTIYPAIARLTMGQEVKVLGESGSGWVRVKTVDSQRIGWVAASLIRKPAH